MPSLTTFTLLCSFFFSTLILPATAIKVEDLTLKYCSKTLTDEEARDFKLLVACNYDEVTEFLSAMKYFTDHNLTKQQIAAVTKSIKSARVSSYKESSLGIQFQWYLTVNDKGDMTLWPIVSKVDPTSPAHESGLKEGDLVTSIDNYQPTGHDCIHQIHSLLRLTPSNTEIQFVVKRSGYDAVNDRHVKTKQVKLSFTTASQ